MAVLEKQLLEKSLNVNNVVTAGLDAAGEIIDSCKKIDADLVVMSTHGRSGFSLNHTYFNEYNAQYQCYVDILDTHSLKCRLSDLMSLRTHRANVL